MTRIEDHLHPHHICHTWIMIITRNVNQQTHSGMKKGDDERKIDSLNVNNYRKEQLSASYQ